LCLALRSSRNALLGWRIAVATRARSADNDETRNNLAQPASQSAAASKPSRLTAKQRTGDN